MNLPRSRLFRRIQPQMRLLATQVNCAWRWHGTRWVLLSLVLALLFTGSVAGVATIETVAHLQDTLRSAQTHLQKA